MGTIPKPGVDKEISVFDPIHITDILGTGLPAALPFGLFFFRFFDGSNGGHIHRPQLGNGLDAEQPLIFPGKGHILCGRQGKGDIPGLDFLNNIILVAFIGDADIVFPVKITF